MQEIPPQQYRKCEKEYNLIQWVFCFIWMGELAEQKNQKNLLPKYAELSIQYVNWATNILSPGKAGGTDTISDSVHL